MKAHTITLSPAINKSLDLDDVIPTNIIETVDDSTKAGITIKPPVDNEALRILRTCSIWHKKSLKVVAQDVTLNGFRITPTTDKENEDGDNKKTLEDIFNDYDNSQALFKVIRDYRTYTHAAFEIAVNRKGELKGFRHIRARTIQMCDGGEKAFQQIGGTSRYFKVYGGITKENKDLYLNAKNGNFSADIPEEQRASTIVWLSEGGEDSDYYHEPEYLEATPVILSEEALESYNYNGLASNGIPNFLIMIAGEFDESKDEETGKTWDEELEDSFKSTVNQPGTAMVIPVKTTGKEAGLVIEVHKLGEPIQEGSYLKLSESNMNKILAAHEVPPSRLGVTINGPLGGSVDEERNKTYDIKTINPLQLMLDSILNKLIKDFLDITDYKHEFTRLDTKNVKAELDIALELVKNGAMTPGQLLETFGDHFNLKVNIKELLTKFPALGQYYVNGQILGSTPDPGIMKNIDPTLIMSFPEKISRILEVTADQIEGIKK